MVFEYYLNNCDSDNLESALIRHGEVGDDDVVGDQLRSNVRHRELACRDSVALLRPVLLHIHTLNY